MSFCRYVADPVVCSTGLFIHRRTDLFVPDTIPLSVARVYRTNDGISPDFGIGTNHNYGMFISNPTGEAYPLSVDLILADGRRVKFRRISGNKLGNSVYRHFSSPASWRGATLRINVDADQWEITTADKTVAGFSAHLPNVLRGIRDRFGNKITITRVGEGGNIQQVTSQNGRT